MSYLHITMDKDGTVVTEVRDGDPSEAFDGRLPTADGSAYASGGVPRFPKATVHMSYFMRVDAVFHMMLEAVAQLRKAGASEHEIAQYRREAIYGNPWAITPRWVSVG